VSATTLPRDTPKFETDLIRAYPCADNVKLLQGTLGVVVAGYAQPCTAVTTIAGAGRVKATRDNTVTGHALGALTVELEFGCFRWANGDTIVQADIGKVAYGLDNQTVTKASSGQSRVGTIAAVDAEGVWVEMDTPEDAGLLAAGVSTQAADVGALTFTAVAGTANTTLEAIPDPTNTPADADALRDDIVAVDLPPIRNNFADLATQINAIRTALRAAGLMA
jgi:hypothetical protein